MPYTVRIRPTLKAGRRRRGGYLFTREAKLLKKVPVEIREDPYLEVRKVKRSKR